jgi:hypothetical protein
MKTLNLTDFSVENSMSDCIQIDGGVDLIKNSVI